MIEIIPTKMDSALILLHSADHNANQFLPFIEFLQEKLPNTYIVAEDGPIAGSPVVQDGMFYGNADKRYWFMFPMKDACSKESFIHNKVAQGASLMSAASYLNNYIDSLSKKISVPHENIVLCGFQHGSCVALSAAMMKRNKTFKKVILIQPYLLEALYLEDEHITDTTKVICIENEYMRKKTYDWIQIYTDEEMRKLKLNIESVITKNGSEEITKEILQEVVKQVLAH